MGACTTCCVLCTCPRETDYAPGRRMILNKNPKYLEDHPLPDSVTVRTAYIEKPDGTLMFSKLFEPKDKTKAKAMICYSIGFGDHTEFYNHTHGVEYAKLGYVVFMVDWAGHGRSDGLFNYIQDFQTDIISDALFTFNYAINKYIKTDELYLQQIDRNNNYFISGMSMGGAITILVGMAMQTRANEYNYKLKGMVVASPMCEITAEAKPPKCVEWILRTCFLCCLPKARLVKNTVGETITDDASLLEEFKTNPCMYEQGIALKTGLALLDAVDSIGIGANGLKLATFIGHGTGDRLTDCNQSKAFYENCGCSSNDKTIKLYENKGHLIYEEEPQIYVDTDEWMMQMIKQNDSNYDDNDEQKEYDDNDVQEDN